jgi:hypothetical protein
MQKSLMPVTQYDASRGEESLINPTRNSLDAELVALCQTFAKSDAQARANMRASMSMDDFNTLITFGNRAAVFAMREKSVEWVNNGLTALAMIEAKRIDARDIFMPLSLLYHSAGRIGANADRLVRHAAKLSETNVATLLNGFVMRSAEDKDIRASWGFDEVETNGFVGFIGSGNRAYQPSVDLKKVIIDIAELVAKDEYQPSRVEVSSELPSVWLRPKENPSVTPLLGKVRAGAHIFAQLRANEYPSYKSHVLMIFLVEMPDEGAVRELREISAKTRPADYSMLGVANGKLFCLVIGRSFELGVPSLETPKTLRRFTSGITEILRRYSNN